MRKIAILAILWKRWSPHDGEALGRRGGMADAIDLGSIARKGVEVRVLSSAPWADGGPWPSGKASPLQGEDRRFESDRVHFPGQWFAVDTLCLVFLTIELS